MTATNKKFLVLATPSLLLVALDLRSEIETTVISWLGVAGYTRSLRWALLPVYQNFINLGSSLPLMSHITVSPIAVLGALLPVQIVQQLVLTTALIATSAIIATSTLSAEIRPVSMTPLSALLLLPTAHYFTVNDWSDNALTSYGTIILLLMMVELNLCESTDRLRPHVLLWIGALHLSIGHFGHLGVPIYALVFTGILSCSNRIFRLNIRRHFFWFHLWLAALLCGLIWLPSAKYLAQNRVISNPRPLSLPSQVKDFFWMGAHPFLEELFHMSPRNALVQTVTHRGFFAVFPLLVISVITAFRSRQKSGDEPKPYRLQVALLASASCLLALTFGTGSSRYPLRPSSDYQFRDAILPLLAFTICLAPSRKKRLTAEFERCGSTQVQEASNRLEHWGRLLLLACCPLGTAIALNFAHSGVSSDGGIEVAGCADAGELATIWVDYPVWRGEQPASPYHPKDCSLLQMIEDNQFSLSGWLKMRQTPSDGDPSFELENRTETLDLVQYSSIYNPEFVPLSSSDLVITYPEPPPLLDTIASRQQAPAYERCDDQSCVISLLRTLKIDESILWNADPNLRWAGEAGLAGMKGGLVTTAADLRTSTKLLYRVPSLQKLSILAAWSLWLGIPIVTIIRVSAASRSRRDAETQQVHIYPDAYEAEAT